MSTEKNPKRFYSMRRFLAAATIVLGIALSVVHYFQFDFLAPVTLVPPWLLLVPALIVVAVSARAVSRSRLLLLVALILVFAVMFVEEVRSLTRFGDLASKDSLSDNQVRVVTQNCNIGSMKAAVESATIKPDIVLLQESPGRDNIDKLAFEFFGDNGSGLYGGDASIIVNGSLKPVHVQQASHFTHAVATLVDGRRVDLVSLRLSAPVFRVDVLSSGFWQDHLKTRRKHREQLAEIRKHLESNAETDIWIVGGDFNLVGNDGALSALPDMSDSFFVAGSGWCNTGTSEYPIFRVDQIWSNRGARCKLSKALPTANSDHRMVVTDMELIEP